MDIFSVQDILFFIGLAVMFGIGFATAFRP
jgi:hypothetical protein